MLCVELHVGWPRPSPVVVGISLKGVAMLLLLVRGGGGGGGGNVVGCVLGVAEQRIVRYTRPEGVEHCDVIHPPTSAAAPGRCAVFGHRGRVHRRVQLDHIRLRLAGIRVLGRRYTAVLPRVVHLAEGKAKLLLLFGGGYGHVGAARAAGGVVDGRCELALQAQTGRFGGHWGLHGAATGRGIPHPHRGVHYIRRRERHKYSHSMQLETSVLYTSPRKPLFVVAMYASPNLLFLPPLENTLDGRSRLCKSFHS